VTKTLPHYHPEDITLNLVRIDAIQQKRCRSRITQQPTVTSPRSTAMRQRYESSTPLLHPMQFSIHPEHTAMKQLKFCCVAIDGQLVFASACWKHSSRPAKISIRYPPDDHIALHNHKPQPPCIKGIKAGGRFR
jgi:hypothetical protein